MAPCMRSCCCYRDMRSACLSAAVFAIVVAGISLLWVIIGFTLTSSYGRYLYEVTWIVILEVLLEVLLLISGILLLIGVRKGYHGLKLIMAFIVLIPIYVLFDVGLQIYGYSIIANSFRNFPWTVSTTLNMLFWIARITVLILCWVAAISLYQILLEEGPNGPPPSTHVVQQHQVITILNPGYPPNTYPAPQQQYPQGTYPPHGQYPPPRGQYSSPQGQYAPPQATYQPIQQGAYGGHYPPSEMSAPPPYQSEYGSKSSKSYAPSYAASVHSSKHGPPA